MTMNGSVQSAQVKIECLKGDITNQPDMDAIVNAANAQLMPGSGVAGAIHSAAGPGLAEECKPLAPIRTGEAVMTGAHDLPNKHVIHCLGPVYGVDRPEDKLLSDCYRNALNLAEANSLKSIAFPALSTGAFGYPMEAAARVALKTVIDRAKRLSAVNHIRFVLFNETDEEVHAWVLRGLMEELT